MSYSEFDLIQDYFQQATSPRDDVVLGIGDDCALLDVPLNKQLAVSMDTLVSGQHFFPDVDPESLGHKALAVNLSDLAAMGAEPAWVTLGLTLPNANEAQRDWLAKFMQGFSALAQQHRLQLIGGDTTQGPLSMSIQVHGFVDKDDALRRDAAKAGDVIYVSGTLGDAGLALQQLNGKPTTRDSDYLIARLEKPTPRIKLGLALLSYASAAIDVSDGLMADLQHICKASGVNALINIEKLPLSGALQNHLATSNDWSLPLSAGDDYELVFTVAAGRQLAFESEAKHWRTKITRIGRIEAVDSAEPRVKILQSGRLLSDVTIIGMNKGFEHFNR